jgi:hypothetical protein
MAFFLLQLSVTSPLSPLQRGVLTEGFPLLGGAEGVLFFKIRIAAVKGAALDIGQIMRKPNEFIQPTGNSAFLILVYGLWPGG